MRLVSAPVHDSPSSALLNDGRDVPFAGLMAKAALWLLVSLTILYMPGVYRWWMTPIYLLVTMGVFFPPFTLMLHCTSHRPLFRKRVDWMNGIIPWGFAPFFGQTPGTYAAHHIGMHHPENNLWNDGSSTLEYQRDRLFDFLRYVTRFFVIGLPELTLYLYRNRRRKLVRRAIAGELIFWSATAALLYLNLWATLTVFVIPLIVARFAMMCGNWGQHAFVDPLDPGSAYRNSITCVNVGYNERCFNDGYHIGHHLNARMHWTELPVEFERNRARYAREGAIVFSGIDFFAVWVLLMVRAHTTIARHIVSMDGASIEERISLMRSRLVPIPAPFEEGVTLSQSVVSPSGIGMHP